MRNVLFALGVMAILALLALGFARLFIYVISEMASCPHV